ncbi:MAG: YvrJ family protein [Bacillota bacterium]
MEDILKLVSSYGFSMIIAIYLLIRIEPIILNLKKSVDYLTLIESLNHDFDSKDYEKINSLLDSEN